jgi:Domain of unknown function (DUF4198)
MRAAWRIALSAMLAIAGAPLAAHDFWIEPTSFHPEGGSVVGIGLRVGQNFVGDPVRRSSGLVEEFVVKEGERATPIAGAEGSDPAGFFIADGRETAVVAYRSTPAFIELPAGRFEDYLRLEGLDAVIAARRAGGQGAKPGLEYFTRYAKALLTGTSGSSAVSRPIGFELEIVPDADPTVGPGRFSGAVLYRGSPLAGALVTALPAANPAARSAVRTDARGRFTFSALKPGVWLIKSVHMVEAGWLSRWFSHVDWQSAWASLTFEVPRPANLARSRS